MYTLGYSRCTLYDMSKFKVTAWKMYNIISTIHTYYKIFYFY